MEGSVTFVNGRYLEVDCICMQHENIAQITIINTRGTGQTFPTRQESLATTRSLVSEETSNEQDWAARDTPNMSDR